MDKFLEVVGIGVVIVVLASAVLVVMAARTDPGLALLAMMAWALPTIVGGVVLAAFGQMLGELKAIRKLAEAQLDAMNSAKS